MEKKVDGLGRVLIPMELRNQLDWCQDDVINIEIEGDSIKLTKRAVKPIDIRRVEPQYIDREKVSKRKSTFKKGDRVILASMYDRQYSVPHDTEGEVIEVDDLGTIFVKWDNGMTAGVTLSDSCSKVVKS